MIYMKNLMPFIFVLKLIESTFLFASFLLFNLVLFCVH